MGVCHSSGKENKKDEKGGNGAGERSPSSNLRRPLSPSLSRSSRSLNTTPLSTSRQLSHRSSHTRSAVSLIGAAPKNDEEAKVIRDVDRAEQQLSQCKSEEGVRSRIKEIIKNITSIENASPKNFNVGITQTVFFKPDDAERKAPESIDDEIKQQLKKMVVKAYLALRQTNQEKTDSFSHSFSEKYLVLQKMWSKRSDESVNEQYMLIHSGVEKNEWNIEIVSPKTNSPVSFSRKIS